MPPLRLAEQGGMTPCTPAATTSSANAITGGVRPGSRGSRSRRDLSLAVGRVCDAPSVGRRGHQASSCPAGPWAEYGVDRVVPWPTCLSWTRRSNGCWERSSRSNGTVPASYPMTLSGLRTACNQTSSRDPVRLRRGDGRGGRQAAAPRELVRVVWADTGRRTLKYHQVLDECSPFARRTCAAHGAAPARAAGAGRAEVAHRAVAPLRRPREVEACLTRMAARSEPLVREPPRHPASRTRAGLHLPGRGRRPVPPPHQPSTARCWPTARPHATRAWSRPTTPWRRPTPTSCSTSCTACRSRPGCSAGSSSRRGLTGHRGRLRAGPRHGVPGAGAAPTPRGSTCRRRWWSRRGADSPTAPTRSATCAG